MGIGGKMALPRVKVVKYIEGDIRNTNADIIIFSVNGFPESPLEKGHVDKVIFDAFKTPKNKGEKNLKARRDELGVREIGYVSDLISVPECFFSRYDEKYENSLKRLKYVIFVVPNTRNKEYSNNAYDVLWKILESAFNKIHASKRRLFSTIIKKNKDRGIEGKIRVVLPRIGFNLGLGLERGIIDKIVNDAYLSSSLIKCDNVDVNLCKYYAKKSPWKHDGYDELEEMYEFFSLLKDKCDEGKLDEYIQYKKDLDNLLRWNMEESYYFIKSILLDNEKYLIKKKKNEENFKNMLKRVELDKKSYAHYEEECLVTENSLCDLVYKKIEESGLTDNRIAKYCEITNFNKFLNRNEYYSNGKELGILGRGKLILLACFLGCSAKEVNTWLDLRGEKRLSPNSKPDLPIIAFFEIKKELKIKDSMEFFFIMKEYQKKSKRTKESKED